MSKIILTDNIIADALSGTKTVTELLEDTYKDEIIARRNADKRCENLDAMQFAFLDAGISRKSKIKDFYGDKDNEWLFPAYVDKRLGETIYKNEILSEICSNVITVDSRSVNGQTIDLGDADNKSNAKKKRVVEGSDIPLATFKTNPIATTLYKRGRAIEATYETLMYMSVDLFTKALDYIGDDVANQEIEDALAVLSNIGVAKTWNTGETALTAERLIEFAVEYYEQAGVPLTTIVMPQPAFVSANKMLINANDVSGISASVRFKMPQGILNNITILYAKVPQVSGTDQIIALNKDLSLTKYVANGSQIREIDKNIRNQTHLGTISEISGFTPFVSSATLRMKQATS